MLLVLGLVAGAVHNTFSLEPGLEEKAREAACASPTAPPVPSPPPHTGSSAMPSARPGGAVTPPPRPTQPCTLQTTLWHASPFARTFGFENGGSRGRVFVQCQRKYWAIGDYACERSGVSGSNLAMGL
jgi:hypothetical protein